MGAPGWPEFAFSTMSAQRTRIVLIHLSVRGLFRSFSAATFLLLPAGDDDFRFDIFLEINQILMIHGLTLAGGCKILQLQLPNRVFLDTI